MRLFEAQAQQPIDLPPIYCIGECTCGNDCHNNANYHQTFTTWNGNYPQLATEIDNADYAYATQQLMVVAV